MRIILASASPRRKELLRQLGWKFTVQVSQVEEIITKTHPAEIVEELSAMKAGAVFEQTSGDVLVIGADTVVADKGKILGKPVDEADAVRMLAELQGGTHEVYTGVCLCIRQGGKENVKTFHESAQVTFYPMSREEIDWYVASKEPMDKAGAYGIQGLGGRFVKGIHGDYQTIVGLPVARLYQEWKKRQKKLVIFDLDGTLLDTIASMKYCGDRALATVGCGPFTPQEYKYFVGEGAARLIEKALLACGRDKLVHFEEVFHAYMEIFKEHCLYQVKPYDGIMELIAALKERGIKIAVLSNKPHAETIAVVETIFGKDCFDWIQGQKPDVARKPSPEGVYQILEGMGFSAREILYVGDTGTDMQTGKGADALTLGVLWGFRDREELEQNKADIVIENPLQVLDYIV